MTNLSILVAHGRCGETDLSSDGIGSGREFGNLCGVVVNEFMFLSSSIGSSMILLRSKVSVRVRGEEPDLLLYAETRNPIEAFAGAE